MIKFWDETIPCHGQKQDRIILFRNSSSKLETFARILSLSGPQNKEERNDGTWRKMDSPIRPQDQPETGKVKAREVNLRRAMAWQLDVTLPTVTVPSRQPVWAVTFRLLAGFNWTGYSSLATRFRISLPKGIFLAILKLRLLFSASICFCSASICLSRSNSL